MLIQYYAMKKTLIINNVCEENIINEVNSNLLRQIYLIH
jgi:hypothetical protein